MQLELKTEENNMTNSVMIVLRCGAFFHATVRGSLPLLIHNK